MTDRELLEWAAKAADYEVKPHVNHRVASNLLFTLHGRNWNPLTDDGDALRLAVKLNIAFRVLPRTYAVEVWHNDNTAVEYYGSHDKEQATRRAIVRAAAAIGK